MLVIIYMYKMITPEMPKIRPTNFFKTFRAFCSFSKLLGKLSSLYKNDNKTKDPLASCFDALRPLSSGSRSAKDCTFFLCRFGCQNDKLL